MDFFLWTEESRKRNHLTFQYEPLQPFFFVSFLHHAQAEAVLDIGANIGAYSMMSSLVDSVQHVYAYEPDSGANSELEQNIVLNGLDKRVSASKLAVSDVSGTLRFGSHAPMAGVNGIVETSIHDLALFESVIEIQSVRLDEQEHLYGKTLGLKIDVEGHELNVIKGAKQLLSLSPCIIQVEHYVGSEIDKVLGGLGYFSFYNAGHDHYFTNIRNFASSDYVKKAVQYASACLIESQTKRWPSGKSIKDALQVFAQVEGNNIKVNAAADRRFFFGELEYAFYLLEDGEKATALDYAKVGSAEFKFDDDKQTVEIKAFVREKKRPQKKIVVSHFVKRPPRGYQPESAVDSAYHAPSNSVAISKNVSRSYFEYSDTDISPLVSRINETGEPRKIIQLGCDSSSIALSCLDWASVVLYCTESQKAILEKMEGFCNADFDKLQVIKYLGEVIDIDVGKVAAIVLRAQFLSDINADWNDLSRFIENLPEDCILYTDGQVDSGYKQAIHALCSNHGLRVEWLYPKSEIIPTDLVKNNGRVVPYPTIVEDELEPVSEHIAPRTVEFIRQLLSVEENAVSGDAGLAEGLGFIYTDEASVKLFDLRQFDADSADFVNDIKKRVSGLSEESTVLVLSEKIEDVALVISQLDGSLAAEVVSRKHGVALFRPS